MVTAFQPIRIPIERAAARISGRPATFRARPRLFLVFFSACPLLICPGIPALAMWSRQPDRDRSEVPCPGTGGAGCCPVESASSKGARRVEFTQRFIEGRRQFEKEPRQGLHG